MARSRNIKPSFFMNEKLAECPPLARLLFAGLWTIADREGRLENRPKKIKVEILPYDDCDITQLLNNLAENGFILQYCVDGENYIQILKFLKHQNPHKKEIGSVIPSYKAQTKPERATTQTGTSPALTLNPHPDSLIPHPSSVKEAQAPFSLPSWISETDWRDFSEMRKKLRKPMTPRAAKSIIKKLEQFRRQGHDTAIILEQSIRNGWQDIYEPKENSYQQPTSAKKTYGRSMAEAAAQGVMDSRTEEYP